MRYGLAWRSSVREMRRSPVRYLSRQDAKYAKPERKEETHLSPLRETVLSMASRLRDKTKRHWAEARLQLKLGPTLSSNWNPDIIVHKDEIMFYRRARALAG